jgi:hypothetical protein
MLTNHLVKLITTCALSSKLGSIVGTNTDCGSSIALNNIVVLAALKSSFVIFVREGTQNPNAELSPLF